MPTPRMADGETAPAEGGVPSSDATESADTGFHNRRLHNYPLIKVIELH